VKNILNLLIILVFASGIIIPKNSGVIEQYYLIQNNIKPLRNQGLFFCKGIKMETTITSAPTKMVSPAEIKTMLPLTPLLSETIHNAQTSVQNILSGIDNRLLLIVGPCSIHDPVAAMDYAQRLNNLRKKYNDRLFIIMRVYFEKPRTSIGWKGLINDPDMDGTCNVDQGLQKARALLLSIASLGLPAGMEMLDPLVSHYIGDLASWAAIGARTSESQTHRELASGLKIPVGFKNGTDGSIDTAISSIIAAANPHSFLDIDYNGQICITRTTGNRNGHLILRGSKTGPNYDSDSISQAVQKLEKNNLTPSIIVDCSHMNAGKCFHNQSKVWKKVITARCAGQDSIRGIMCESNINEGNQKISESLAYGVSVTDECIGWEETEELIGES
jgi:3-deoxy-7-phosphoheptulonate synthase